MHEYSIVSALLTEVEARAEEAHATRVALVTVRLGAQSGVDPGLLATAFETVAVSGVCAGAELELEVVPAQWACPRCSAPAVEGRALRCEPCARPLQLVSGDEIVLTHLELEVPDHVH